ncbi:UNVERIFIED_CONTAM: hypothetical protein Sindi_0763200 [Sesamum indicum]
MNPLHQLHVYVRYAYGVRSTLVQEQNKESPALEAEIVVFPGGAGGGHPSLGQEVEEMAAALLGFRSDFECVYGLSGGVAMAENQKEHKGCTQDYY